MAMLAMCMPILPGKKEMWLQMMEQLKQEPMGSEFKASRENAGVHERTFLQETPNGDFIIITLEGDNPAESFAQIMSQAGPEFAAFAQEVHGLDMSAAPVLPTLAFDSRG